MDGIPRKLIANRAKHVTLVENDYIIEKISTTKKLVVMTYVNVNLNFNIYEYHTRVAVKGVGNFLGVVCISTPKKIYIK